MKQYISIICFFLLLGIKSNAQQPHFVYLQTDNNQPFYVMLKGKNYSSSSIGYVILPKLLNGDYRIKVGFAKNEMPEQDYLLKIKDDDLGYLIKNFGEKGSGLFNLQTMAIQYSGEIGKQMDAVANAQRDAERQKVIIQQQKDSTEKAEAAVAEQQRIDNQAKLIAAAEKEKEDAAALVKQQSLDSVKNENVNKVSAAKQKREAIALANQQRIDSIKSVHASKVALAKQKAIVKHEADSIAAATNPIAKKQPIGVETLAQKKVRLAKEAALKRQVAATALQSDGQAKTEEQKKQDAIIAQNKAAENIRRITDSLKTVEKNRLQTELEATAAKQRIDSIALAKQQAQDQASAELQKNVADNIQRKNDSLAMVEKGKLQVNEASPTGAKNDSSILIANSNIGQPSSKNVNATIVYEPKVLNRIATDSGTIMTYKIPSSKGWDTVTAFIKGAPVEKKEIPAEKKVVVEDANQSQPSNGVKFLDIHFKQDSANKTTDLITPVFKKNKPEKIVSSENASTNLPTQNKETTSNSSPVAVTPVGNSNCRAEANDKDFYALRKKMVAQDDADNMIMTAKKSMREKCYSTIQIRNLSVLLITDADRYQFLEAAYPFTSDAYNYGNLADLLKDNYYVERFKVMLKR